MSTARPEPAKNTLAILCIRADWFVVWVLTPFLGATVWAVTINSLLGVIAQDSILIAASTYAAVDGWDFGYFDYPVMDGC